MFSIRSAKRLERGGTIPAICCRRRFLSWWQVTMWLLWAVAASKGASSGSGGERVGDAQRRLRDDEGVALVGLGVAREQPGGLVRGEPGQVRDAQPASLAREIASKPMLRHWSTRRLSHATWENRPSRSPSSCGRACARPLPRVKACPVRRLADVDAQNGLGRGYCMAWWYPSNRRSMECCFRDTHYMALILAERPQFSYQSSETAAPASATPGPLGA